MAKNLTIIRGNTTSVSLTISPIDLRAGDMVYFTAKPAYDNDSTDSSAIIQKDVTAIAVGSPDLDFVLTPNDTNVEPGKYVYDITANFAGRGRTQLLTGKLTVKPSVTLRGIN